MVNGFYVLFENILTGQYPMTGAYKVWTRDRQQRISNIYFWQLVEHHCNSLITFSPYVHKNHRILSSFRYFFLCFVTNYDRLHLKSLTGSLQYDFFSLLTGLLQS